MPYLGDYLGQLISEISMARMQADLETVRLAELYAAHPLLRTMPVPHMRLPNVDLEIPILVKESEAPREGESARGGLSPVSIRKKFGELLTAQLSKANITLSNAERKKLRSALDERLTLYSMPVETSVDVKRVADDLTTLAIRTISAIGRASVTEEIPEMFSTDLKEAVRLEFLKLRPPPPRLMVLVTSAEIREAGSTENITRLRLKISEQGLEWTTVESEGIQSERLIPE